MKNISRRVFIKGLAVAGVAAAASTVLAGCNTNMIPGVDDNQDDETPEAPVTTITFTDPDNSKNTLTVVSKSFALGEVVLGNNKKAEIEFQISNHLAQSAGVAFVNGDISASAATAIEQGGTKVGSYYVDVSAYADGSVYNVVSLTDVDTLFATTDASNNIKDAVKTYTVGFDVDSSKMKKNVTVKMSFMKVEQIAATGGTNFYPVVKEIDSKEFTYTL